MAGSCLEKLFQPPLQSDAILVGGEPTYLWLLDLNYDLERGCRCSPTLLRDQLTGPHGKLYQLLGPRFSQKALPLAIGFPLKDGESGIVLSLQHSRGPFEVVEILVVFL